MASTHLEGRRSPLEKTAPLVALRWRCAWRLSSKIDLRTGARCEVRNAANRDCCSSQPETHLYRIAFLLLGVTGLSAIGLIFSSSSSSSAFAARKS